MCNRCLHSSQTRKANWCILLCHFNPTAFPMSRRFGLGFYPDFKLQKGQSLCRLTCVLGRVMKKTMCDSLDLPLTDRLYCGLHKIYTKYNSMQYSAPKDIR